MYFNRRSLFSDDVSDKVFGSDLLEDQDQISYEMQGIFPMSTYS